MMRWHRPGAMGLLVVLLASADAAALDARVTFEVQNVNRSLVPCAADLGTYTVEGRLVAPEPLPDGVTLYLHGLGFGAFFWNVPGSDFAAAMAENGHASVFVDRIGYDATGHPNGYLSCLGAQADVAIQIVTKLKGASYAIDGGAPVAFDRVALAGHSAGGAVAQIAAYSFGGIDALAVLAYADQGASDLALSAFGDAAVTCATGGEEAEPGEPSGYAPFGATDEAFAALMFHDVDPAIASAVTATRNRDPCGDDASILTEIVASQLLLGLVDVPVLVACAGEDAIFPPSACEAQDDHFTGSTDVTLETVPGIGHAVTVEREAAAFRDALSGWLGTRGF